MSIMTRICVLVSSSTLYNDSLDVDQKLHHLDRGGGVGVESMMLDDVEEGGGLAQMIGCKSKTSFSTFRLVR